MIRGISIIKAIMILIVAGVSINLIYKALTGKATGPFTKQVQLFWSGEDGGMLGKWTVIISPIVLIGLIYIIF
jgi:hypothetical protein